MEENIIYALHCPVMNKPVYVGKSKVGLDRPFNHLNNKSHSDKVNKWVEILKSEGKEPIIVILDKGSNDEITGQKEIFWINYYISKGYFLLNQSMINTNHLQMDLIESTIDEDDPLKDIRLYVKIKRKQLKLSQKEFAERAGVGLRFLRELEQGYKINFNTEPIIKVLKLIGKGYLSVGI